MTFTAQTYTDMVQLLSEHPEWRVQLRNLLLPEGEYDLLLSVSVLAESQRRTESRMRRVEAAIEHLAEAQQRTEEKVAALAEAQQRTESGLERVEKAVEALAEAQQRTESRPERVEKAVEALAEAQQRTEEKVAALAEAQQHTESRLDKIEAVIDRLVEAQRQTGEQLERIVSILNRHTDQIDKLRGWHLEYEYRTKAYGYFGRILRKTRLVDHSEMLDELEPHVSPGELEDAALIDLVVSGRPRMRPDLPEVWLALEVSGVIDREDINRARRRANLLQKTGHLTISVVAGEDLTLGARDELTFYPVVLMKNGRIEFWEDVLSSLAPPPPGQDA